MDGLSSKIPPWIGCSLCSVLCGNSHSVGQPGMANSPGGRASALGQSSLCSHSFLLFLTRNDVQMFSPYLSLPIIWKANFSSSFFIIFSVSFNVVLSVYYLQCVFQFSFWNFSSFHHLTFLFHSMLFIIQYVVLFYLSLAFTFL